jgi:hypothetical protein
MRVFKSTWLLLCLSLILLPSLSHAQSAVTVLFGDDNEAFETLLPCVASGTCTVTNRTTITDLIVIEQLAQTAQEANNPTKEATANANPTTPATTYHGLPGNNPAHGGSSASPEGNGVNDGNGIHNIAGGAPGQNADQTTPADGGDPPACDMHGGLDAANNNCEQ